MKQIIFFILLLTAIAYSQPIDTTSSGTGGLTQGQVESIVGDSTYALRLALANRNLSNLGTTAINTNLNPGANNSWSLGGYGSQWSGVRAVQWEYWDGTYLSTLRWALSITGVREIYLPNASGTIALISDLASYAPLASPTFTGTVTLPTATSVGLVSSAELGYLDGVTSAIQTQLNAKLSSTALSGTINTLAYFNTSSTVDGLSTATYPTLGELSYVKGTTSNIQNQINARATTVAVGDSFNTRMGAILDIDDMAVVRDYEPVMQDSSMILYRNGVWEIFDFGDAMANVIVSLPDSIVYTSEVAGDSIIGTSATLDSIITDYWAGVLQNARTKTSYDISNPALVDTFMVFWLDDAITIDSVKAESTDSIKIQVLLYDTRTETGTNLYAAGGVLVNGTTTLTTFSDNALTADTKAYLYFTLIGDTATRLRLKFYWRYN